MITIDQLAKLANVSKSTVSKALNDRPDVSRETKEKIVNIARKYDFTPNAFGKGLKTRRTGNLGVIFYRDIVPLSTNPFYSRVLEGIEAEVAVNNLNLILNIISEEQQSELPKMVREKQIDGLILVGILNKEYVERILNVYKNTILVDPKSTTACCSQVLIDNELGAFQATEYLIRKGHTRIGFISGSLDRLSFSQRYDGYQKALKRNRLPLDARLVRTGGIESGYDHVKELLIQQKPTAIFAANDINAIYGYKAIHELNMRIPRDISVVGFDDIELARLANPPLTSVRVYKEELGSLAVRMLVKIINNELKEARTVIVPTKLVERESVRDLKS